jgi:hypothetical protein
MFITMVLWDRIFCCHDDVDYNLQLLLEMLSEEEDEVIIFKLRGEIDVIE